MLELCALIAAIGWLSGVVFLSLKSDIARADYGLAYLVMRPNDVAKLAAPVALLAFGLGAIPLVPNWFRLTLAGLALPVMVGDLLLARWFSAQIKKGEAKTKAGIYALHTPSQEETLDAARWLCAPAWAIVCLLTIVYSGLAIIHFDQDAWVWVLYTLYVLFVYTLGTAGAVLAYSIGYDLKTKCHVWRASIGSQKLEIDY